MSDVKSKNMYELLGNDPDEDSDREPEPPTQAIDKPLPRTGKRDAPDVPHSRGEGRDRGGRGGRGRGRGRGGSEGAFQDREAGSTANRSRDYTQQTDRPYRGGRGDRPPRGTGRGREFRDNREDRHSRGQPNEHVKQADQSWGAPTGGSEWDDEKAGEQIAKEDAGDGFGPSENAPTNAEGEKPDGESGQTEAVPGGEAAEAEKVGKSYDEYLAEQLEKRANLGSSLEARKANEGSKADKKWANAKPISKDEEEDSYISGKGGKTTRQRERKEKQTVEIDHRFQEAPRGDRGGRGRGRGGDFRGDRGGGRGRGRGDGFRGESRGEYRGNRGGGGRGGRGENVNVSDENAFPSLGA